MTRIGWLAVVFSTLALFACSDEKATEAPPPPATLTASAIGHYCGMNVLEHTGPKGQIVLADRDEPVWFSSARDTLAFTMLPEEPKDIRAIYVSDMGKAPSWEHPGEANWVDAKNAIYVVGSRMQGGMGGAEAVPFSDEGAAKDFADRNGGHLARFGDIPKDYVLGSGSEATGSAGETGAVDAGGAGSSPPPKGGTTHSH